MHQTDFEFLSYIQTGGLKASNFSRKTYVPKNRSKRAIPIKMDWRNYSNLH